jgi:adenine-specific DNA methylase
VSPAELLLLAGRLPEAWRDAVAESPERVAARVEEAVSSCVGEARTAYAAPAVTCAGPRAIEDGGFPFERLSDIAELESWRKELNRPVYHIHKWWAQRLGSVFRAILLGAFAPRGSDILRMFYQSARISDAVVLDPFMGSGTTVGEALKLGARAIGRDINPVAHLVVRSALRAHDRKEVLQVFEEVERDVAPTIRRFYRAKVSGDETADVLYYFWVKTVSCPSCRSTVDLFSSYVFAQHASPRKHPEARAVCPACGALNVVLYNAKRATCSECSSRFGLKDGPARGARATCPACDRTFTIAKAVQETGKPPDHRMYAKLVLRANGTKTYLATDDYDERLYRKASRALKRHAALYPVAQIAPGYNTNQVLNYCYSHWHQMFNDRQLLCLGLLGQRIGQIEDPSLRELMACLFSGTLEFNNMFASYKGEGTGAVRHMFSHHILKPERTPLEANPWGTPRSSGAFSTLFERRILRALDYSQDPFEIRVRRTKGKARSEKIYGLSRPLGHEAAETFAEFESGKSLYLSCGDSARTDLASGSVDAVVTDPPFFDNVHYSQLADFFYVWQQHVLGSAEATKESTVTTRSSAEVQQSNPAAFTHRLRGVLAECHRVLRPDGLLVFTYHHSRTEGWRSILTALFEAGFVITATQPVKAEMSVAQPKRQAKSPIDLDVIVVCRKRGTAPVEGDRSGDVVADSAERAIEQIRRFNGAGRLLSRNDVRVVVMAQVIRQLSGAETLDTALALMESCGEGTESVIDRLHEGQRLDEPAQTAGETQLTLW